MVFSTIEFLFQFLPIFLLAYYATPQKYRNITLIIGSLVFYAIGSGWYTLLLLLSLVINYGLSRLISGSHARHPQQAKRYLIGGLVYNFGLLVVFKYTNFLIGNLNSLLSIFHVAIPKASIIMPLGISFYTFQSMGYLIDVYNGKYAPEKNPAKFALFVSFFPQLIQGPIARFDQLESQLITPHRFDLDGIERGLLLMLWGWFKKKVIADRALPLVEAVFGNQSAYGGAVIVVGVLFYSLQQYADFSGGIDLVTGIAQLFGIRLAPNFKRPYFSVSLGDFWRRWHISLGSWMRDYVFYPFALTRPVSRMSKALKKKAGTHIARALPAALGNILVFLLVGVWHGAQMNYVLWGLYNGVILAFTALVEPVYKKMNERLPRLTASGGFHLFRILRTFLVVNIGWYFDRCVRVSDAFAMLHKTFFAFNARQLFDGTLDTLGLAAKDYRILLVATILLFVVSLMQERGVKIRDFVLSRPLVLRWAVLYAFIFFVLATFGGSNVAASGFMYAVF